MKWQKPSLELSTTQQRENQNTQHLTMLPAYSAYMQVLHVSIPQGYFMHRISVSIPQVLTLSFHRKPFLSRHDLQNNWRRQNPKLGIYFQTIYLTEIITKWPDKSYHTTGIWCESPTVQPIWNRLKNRIIDRTFMKFKYGGPCAKCNLLLPAIFRNTGEYSILTGSSTVTSRQQHQPTSGHSTADDTDDTRLLRLLHLQARRILDAHCPTSKKKGEEGNGDVLTCWQSPNIWLHMDISRQTRTRNHVLARQITSIIIF